MIKETLAPKYKEGDVVDFYCYKELDQDIPPVYQGKITSIIENSSEGYKFDKYTYAIDNHNCKSCLSKEISYKTIQVYEQHIKGVAGNYQVTNTAMV